jgi:hypothetical protein
MATYLEDATQTLGVTGSEYDEEIYAPVSLSSTTRRAIRPTEMTQNDVNYFSIGAKLDRERDAYYDAQHDKEMERRAKAAAWNDKVKSQQQGAVVAEALVDLDPTASDYLSRVSELRTQYPMGVLSDSVKSTMKGKDDVYKETYESRKRAEEQRISRENSDYNRDQQLEVNLQSTTASKQAGILEDVSKMDIRARTAFKEAVDAGNSPLEAFSIANDTQKTEITSSDYRVALSNVAKLRSDKRKYETEIAKFKADILSQDSEEAKEAIRNLETELTIVDSEIGDWYDTSINPYKASRGQANPKSEPDPENDAPLETPEPDKPAKESVPGELKPDFTPISLSDIERRTGKKWAVGQVIENNGKQYVVTK